jgi:hypothetical protein
MFKIVKIKKLCTTMVSNQLPIFQYKQLADFIHTFTQISYIQSHRFLSHSTVLYNVLFLFLVFNL